MSDPARSTIDPACLALLRDPSSTRALDALRMALATLAATGHIAIDPAAGSESFVRIQRAPGAGMPAHIVAVYRVLRDAARSGLLTRVAARTALTDAFGHRFHHYTNRSVAPELVARGLLHVETKRLLWLFTVRKERRTATGDAEAAKLSRQLAELDTLPTLLEHDPSRALQLARNAGALLLLSAPARTAIPRLHSLASAGSAYALVEEPEMRWLEFLEQAEELMSLDFETLLNALDVIAEFGGDSGSGSGADADGGGDGGGGD